MDQYLKDNEQENLKARLYGYLKDKASRRAGVTSKNAYEGGEEQFLDQMALHDAGSLVGAASEGAGMAGTIGGKYAKSDIVPKMNDALYKSTQGAYENFKTLRGLEEQSNMNDLRVADYVANLERADDQNDLQVRDRDYRDQLYKDSAPDRDLKRKMLQKQLAQRAATKRKLADDIKGPKGQPVLLDESGNPTMLDGYSYREKPLAAGAGGTMAIVPGYEGPNGELLMRDKFGNLTTQNLPDGFRKPKDEKLTEAEKNASMYYNNAENALKVLEDMEDRGYKPSRLTEGLKMLTPEEFEADVMSDDDAKYLQAARDFTAAKLRLESGANIPDSEINTQAKIYMRKAGESDGLLKQKRASRREALKGLEFKAGRGAAQINSMGGKSQMTPKERLEYLRKKHRGGISE